MESKIKKECKCLCHIEIAEQKKKLIKQHRHKIVRINCLLRDCNRNLY